MSNPLDPIRAWYRLSLDCMKVAQRTARIGLHQAVTDKHATLFHLTPDARVREIEDAKDALSRLTVVDFAAVFERTLRVHIVEALSEMIPDAHPMFGSKLRAQVSADAEMWKYKDELVEMFPTIDGRVRGMVKDVIAYRNWAAHGWHTTLMKAPSNITAEDAYQRLTDFLKAAGIVS